MNMKWFCICLLVPLLVTGSVNAAEAPRARLDEKQRAFFTDLCLKCHGPEKQEGKFRVDDLPFEITTVEVADRWQKVLNQVNSGEMPPEDQKQPEREAKTNFLEALSETMVVARKSLSDVGGKITMRRLNRREYKNTIRDLLGVEIGVKELPADGGAGTFDTVGSSLFMSSDQFEQYLALGRTAIDESFARFVVPAGSKPIAPRRIHIETEDTNERIKKGLQQRIDFRERYVKWTSAVDEAAKKPENVAVADEIRKAKPGSETHFYSQWQRIKGAPSPKEFGWGDDINADQQGRRDWVHFVPHHRAYVEHPLTKTGTFLTIDDAYVNSRQAFRIPTEWPTGDYVVRVRIAAMDGIAKERRFVEFGPQHESGVCTVASTHEISGTTAAPQLLEIPVKVTSSSSRIYMFRERGSHDSDAAASRLFAEARQRNGVGPEFALWLDWIEVESRSMDFQSVPSAPQGSTSTAQEKAKMHGQEAHATAVVQKLRKDPEQWANKYMPIYADGYLKKYERFKKWCDAIDKAAEQPENADVVKKLREDPKLKTQPHLFYNQWEQIKGAPSPKEFEFRDVDDAQFARSEYSYHFRYYDDYQKLPQRETGSYLMLYSLGRYTGIAAPANWPAGNYSLRIRLAATDESPKERRFIEIGTGKADAADFNVLSSHQVTGTLKEPQTLVIPVTINASGDRNFAIRDKRPNNREAEYAMFREAWDKTGTGPRPCIWIDYVELEGPIRSMDIQSVPSAHQDSTTTSSASEKTNGLEAHSTRTIKQRREVELHANAMVGGTYNGYFKGGHAAAKEFLATGKPQKGIPDEQEAKFRIKVFEENGPTFVRYLDDPLTKTGAYLTIFNVHPEEVITLPPDQPSGWLKTKHEVERAAPGEYMLRFRIGAVKDTPKERHFVAFGSRMKPVEKEDFTLLKTFQISGTTDEPQIIEVPISITADGPRTFVLREKRDVKLDHEIYTAARKETGVGPVSALWIDWVEWEGPLERGIGFQPVTSRRDWNKNDRQDAYPTKRIEPEIRRADVERGHLRFKYLNEQYAKWKAAGADESRLKEFDFNDKSHAEFAKTVWDQNNRWFQQYLDWPLSKTGLYLDNTVNETSEFAIDLPADIGNGDYTLRVKIGRVPDMPAERAFLTFVEASPIDKDDRTFLANKQITATLDNPEIIELPFKVRPGGPRKFVLFEKRPLKKEAISLPGRTRAIADPKQRDPVLWIDWIEYEGPLSAPTPTSPPPILIANTTGASERDHARAILERFAVRAFRDKQPSAAYIDRLVKLFEARIAAGDRFDIAIREPLSVVLASPGFLYLAEPRGIGFQPVDSSNGGNKNDRQDAYPTKLTQQEVAVRLSYFLWSAPPDEELLDLARRGELNKADALARQVDRMLASPKSDEFVSGFVHQWLNMERLDFFQFDTKQFRDFDESAKAASRREVYETFAHVLRHNESLGRLLKSDYVLINGLLATYYGIEGISGDEFRKVPVPEGSPRGGLLGMAAILAMGSNGERSSPVERGAWVLRKLLHDPPPPAPPNVPQLDRLNGKPLSARERLLAHQEQPQCLQCHRKIDPIGFGLENFNAAGKWRTVEVDLKLKKDWPINPAGAIYKGPPFNSYFELRDLIAAREADFARGFTENLIEYALGRPFGFSDAALSDAINARARDKQFAMKEFVTALVLSAEFQSK